MRILKLSIFMGCLLTGQALASSSVLVPSSPAEAAKDIRFQKAVRALPEEEQQLITQYMFRAAMGAAIAGVSGLPTGIPIAEAVAAQKAFNDKQRFERETESNQDNELNHAVSLHDTRVEAATESGYRGDTVKVSTTVKNTSGQAIAGVKVFVEANDIFGDRLGSYGLKSDETIPPNGELTLSGHYGGEKVLKADQSKVSVKAEPIHVVFEDRSELKSSRRVIGF